MKLAERLSMLCKNPNTKDNIMEDIELFKKMKTMSRDELISYSMSVTIAKWLLNIIGVGAVLLSLFFTNISTMLVACLVFWVVGGMAVGADTTQDFIGNLLATKFNDK